MHELVNAQKGGQTRFFGVLALFSIITFSSLFLISRGVSSIRIIGFYILIGWAATLPVDDLLCLITVALPGSNIFKITGGFTVIPFLMVIYILKTLSRNRWKINANAAKPLLWIIVSLFISISTAIIHHFSLGDIIPFYLHMIFIVFAHGINNAYLEDRYSKLAICFITGTLMVCLGTAIFPSVSRSISNIGVYARSNAGFSSVWDFGRSLSISIAFVLVDVLKHRNKLVLNSLLSLILIYYLIQCGRFSMLLGLGALLICIPFAYGGEKPVRIRIMYSIFTLFITGILGFLVFRYVYSSMIELRGTGASDNGRFEIWGIYIQYLLKNPSIALFGSGGGTISSVASLLGTVTAHNIVIEKLVEFGIVGFIVLTIAFRKLYRGCTLSITKNVNILPLVTFLATAMTQGTTGNASFALLLAICVKEL